MKRSVALGLIFITLLTGSQAAARAIYSTSHQQIYTVRQTVTVKNTGGRIRNLTLTLPSFMDQDAPPYQRLLATEYSTPKLHLVRKPWMAEAEYHQDIMEAGRVVSLELRYRLINYAIEYELLASAGSGSSEAKYLNPEPGVESDREELLTLARSLTEYQPYPLGKAKKLFEYVNHHLEYQQDSGSKHSAWATWKRGWGNCEDFSLLYIALCRAVGIPARLIGGYRFDSTTIGNDWVDLEALGHVWVEVNLPVLGWIPVDPTYIYSVNGEKQINYDFFGKIVKSDSHLFLCYLRQRGPRYRYQSDSKNGVQLEMEYKLLIRKG